MRQCKSAAIFVIVRDVHRADDTPKSHYFNPQQLEAIISVSFICDEYLSPIINVYKEIVRRVLINILRGRYSDEAVKVIVYVVPAETVQKVSFSVLRNKGQGYLKFLVQWLFNSVWVHNVFVGGVNHSIFYIDASHYVVGAAPVTVRWIYVRGHYSTIGK